MKYGYYIFLCAVLTLCFSCKKSKSPVEVQVAPIPPITDSVSFSIGGKLFTVIESATHISGSGNAQANLKLDSIGRVNNVYYYSGSKDSLMFNHDITIVNHAKTTGDDIVTMTFSIMKKYGKNQLSQNAGIVVPPTLLPLYNPGNYSYAFDFNRENSREGVAISISRTTNNIGTISSSYSSLLLKYPTKVTKATQADTGFQIISLSKSDAGQYYIIARFNALLFDGNENQTRLDNGYLRLLLQ